LGFIAGDDTARVARTAALFFANFHFISVGTSYFGSQLPPSALQNYWTLSVEEQFYVVYPTLFLLTALLFKHISLRRKLEALLVVSIVASFVWSVHQTSTNLTAAYFSPFTRAWELGLGALVAVASPRLAKLPGLIATIMTWAGLIGIFVAAFLFNASTAYPGSAVALPVIATALVVAGGRVHPGIGAEALLRLPPFQWLGKLSYSLYLWHWPILIIAAQHVGHPLSVGDNLLWLVVALALSAGSYFLVENPIRHWSFLTRSGWRSLALGAVLISTSHGLVSFEIGSQPSSHVALLGSGLEISATSCQRGASHLAVANLRQAAGWPEDAEHLRSGTLAPAPLSPVVAEDASHGRPDDRPRRESAGPAMRVALTRRTLSSAGGADRPG
jgi:peptidoglycan/LPS O-acetylase OafA/YrhL